MSRSEVIAEKKITCYHCGELCKEEVIVAEEKPFCCTGCKLVYELLNENNLCTYYQLNANPGISPRKAYDHKFDYLDLPEVKQQLIHFSSNGQVHVRFYLPAMHCSSCIWLLENMHRFHAPVIQSTVNFPLKEVTIRYNEQETNLSTIAGLLTGIGYEPLITLSDMEKKPAAGNKTRIIKMAVAGFCFGNIMMLSFPEYFGMANTQGQAHLKLLFNYLNLLLSLPVLFYSASEFFVSAWKSIRQRYLNIDAPIALAIAVTFLRSVYEIASDTGTGYFDSMSGIVFFMLIGRYVQNKTHDTLSFERDYKSYFPLAVRLMKNGKESSKPVSQLKPGDVMVIRNQELIPADARLLSPQTHIDYSFVSGESAPVKSVKDDMIYAGGRQLDGAILLKVTRSVSQSYLTSLWNEHTKDNSRKKEAGSFTDHINRYFTLAVFAIAITVSIYWIFADASKALNAFSAVLIVACPCGLLLTASFTNGGIIRLMGRQGCYLKNAEAIESMSGINTIVFDKTGTITSGSEVVFKGTLSEHDLRLAVSLAAQSVHVLSRKICEQYAHIRPQPVTAFNEITGHGIQGEVDGDFVRMGSGYFITGRHPETSPQASMVFLSVNGVAKGFFSIANVYRPGFDSTINVLKGRYELHLLSGDHDTERKQLAHYFSPGFMHFNQRPGDKLAYIKKLQQEGKRVMMIGDGLNDAHAFRQSDMSLAVSDETSSFSPACDGILAGSSFAALPGLLRFSKQCRHIIAACFSFSLLYNVAGLFFAIQGTLSPVIAAILMPSSSVSIVLISTFSIQLMARKPKSLTEINPAFDAGHGAARQGPIVLLP